MKFKQEDDGQRGFFLALTNEDSIIGEMSYLWTDNHNVMVINHTGVDSKYAGEGVGRNLVMNAVDYAREKDKKILPVCSFAASVFDGEPEISDVRLME